MKQFIEGQFNFFADVNPPLNVEIRMKSTDRFCEGPKIWTLSSESRATIEEHLEDLGGRYDLWQFLHPCDEYEWEAKLTARCG